ncbi:MAG: hypothetical protein AAF567_14870 [Actinomycetota bacterium]
MIDIVLVALTTVIAAAAVWMAVGLLRRERWRVDNLRAIGLVSSLWPTAIGGLLLVAVVGLVVGWWITAIGIAAIVVIKAAYVLMLVAYRRAGRDRKHDVASVALSAHSIAALALILGW